MADDVAEDAWRAAADDEWLAERRSGLMAWLRRLPVLRGIGGAVSHADTGPYAGAPRDPDLRVDDGAHEYSVVRYATHHIAYTSTSTRPEECPRCGQPVSETHELAYVDGGQARGTVGAVRACRDCHPESWLRRSHMPGPVRRRAAARRNVV
ncbi:hypothetical protein WEI85_37705 [Actinomycetes bacterium KLBMP 9797]